jgi:hypothetical protein
VVLFCARLCRSPKDWRAWHVSSAPTPAPMYRYMHGTMHGYEWYGPALWCLFPSSALSKSKSLTTVHVFSCGCMSPSDTSSCIEVSSNDVYAAGLPRGKRERPKKNTITEVPLSACTSCLRESNVVHVVRGNFRCPQKGHVSAQIVLRTCERFTLMPCV